MEENLISKKELLELTGISYGQLYRWKRKNLIPEVWFIRKSTFTGQETFFPRQEMLARVERIKNMKEDLSLDALADMFSPSPSDVRLSLDEIASRNIVTRETLKVFAELYPDISGMGFIDILAAYAMDRALRTGEVTRAEAGQMVRTVEEHIEKFHGKSCDLLFVRNLGIGTCLLVDSSADIYFDSNSNVAVRISMADCVEQIKMLVP